MKDPVLGKNKKLRQAMSMAFDTETLISQFYNGRAIVAHSPIPPDIDGYEESFRNTYKTFDLQKARALMKEAGFENGEGLPTFDYDTLSTTTSRQMAESFQQQMGQLGIKLNIRTNTWPQFQERIKNGTVQIYGVAWGADYPDAQNFLQLFYSKNVSPGPNGANYQNPAFDKLYEAALKLPPGPARTKLYHQMRDIVVEDTPWILATHRLGYYLHHGWLKNFKPQSIIGDQFQYLRIDNEERAKRKSIF
jgi:oligopeptide transport system substrate-binding protein